MTFANDISSHVSITFIARIQNRKLTSRTNPNSISFKENKKNGLPCCHIRDDNQKNCQKYRMATWSKQIQLHNIFPSLRYYRFSKSRESRKPRKRRKKLEPKWCFGVYLMAQYILSFFVTKSRERRKRKLALRKRKKSLYKENGRAYTRIHTHTYHPSRLFI